MQKAARWPQGVCKYFDACQKTAELVHRKPTTVSMSGNIVELVDNFVYLGYIQSSDGYCRPDIRQHIGFTSLIMSSLQRIWTKKCLTLLYTSQTWTLLATDTRRLESFHMKCQRHLGLSWHDNIHN